MAAEYIDLASDMQSNADDRGRPPAGEELIWSGGLPD